jgi:F-type H+-transporting ATPase subunit b
MAEPNAHTEAPAGPNAFPPFQSQNFPSQIFWLVLTFVLLFVLMWKVALPRIGSILAQREKRIADDLEAAHGFKEQSEAANAAYEKSLADARARAQSIASATHAQQLAEAEAINKRLEAELHERLAAAEQLIAAKRTAAMGNVETIAADLASAIVERLIGKAPSAQDVAAVLGDTVKR